MCKAAAHPEHYWRGWTERAVLFISLQLAATPCLSHGLESKSQSTTGHVTDGYSRQPAFDVLHYKLTISASDTNNVIRGETIINLHRLDPIDTTLTLDLKDMNVTSIQVDGIPAKYSQRERQIEVVLSKGGPTDDTLRLAIR
jgi:aminopeptidase N